MVKVTRHQLRRMILKEFDVINAESGEISEFAPSLEAALDIMKRLKVAPTKEDGIPHGEEAWLSGEDWEKYYKETEGKRWTRGKKKESDRLDADNLLARLDKWAADAGSDYAGDNPGIDMQDVARDLAASAEYSFEPDEWEVLQWHFDRESDFSHDEDDAALIDYIASMISEGRMSVKDLRNLIREVAGIPGWLEDHFAWRNVVFTRDDEVRYINDVASPETIAASDEMANAVPSGANVLVVKGANPGSKSEWIHDSELLELIDSEGWHEKPPPEGADPSGFWDGRGEWLEPADAEMSELPPELPDLPPAELAIPEGKIRIRKSDLARMIHEISDEQGHEQSLFDDDQQRAAEEGFELNFIDWTADLINSIRAIGDKYGQKRDERVGKHVFDLFGAVGEPVEERAQENLPRDVSFYDEWHNGKGSRDSAWRQAELTFADMFLAERRVIRVRKGDLQKAVSLLFEEAPPSGSDPKVKDFLKLYAKQKPNTMKKVLGITAKLTAGIAVGLLVGSVAGVTTAGIGTAAGIAAGGAAARAAEQAIGMIYDKIAERSGEMAQGLIAYLSTPDDSTDPLAKFFDIEDEYVKLLQGLDSDLGKKFQKELFAYYKRMFDQIDEEADGDKPLSEFLSSTANQYFQHFLFKHSKSGVGVKVQPSR